MSKTSLNEQFDVSDSAETGMDSDSSEKENLAHLIESLSEASSVDNLDLAYWRDFLKLLKDMGVQGFSRGDTAITFYRDWDPELVSIDGKSVKDEDGKVPGFIPSRMPRPAKPESAFQNPSLWPATGKPYSFGD